MQDVILKMENISKRFPGTQALMNVGFDLRKGEINSIIGPNGSGKSTLMNILSGTLQPTEGDIYISGEKVAFSNPSHAIRGGIVMIHQELKLIPEISAAENIFFGRFQTKNNVPFIDWKKTYKMAQEIVESLGSQIDVRKRISKLSVAECQMIEIARALSQKADILIMDEPTASLSTNEIDVLFRTMRNISARGVSVIYISHRLDEVLEISDRINVLRDSKLVKTLDNTPDVTKDMLVELMVQKKIVNHQKVTMDMSDKPTLLSVKNLSYSDKLTDISFDVREGEVVGIAGLLGTGRTELLKCIFGVYKTSSGQLTINGKRYVPRNTNEAVKNGIALLSEDRKREGLILSMPIEDNMIFSSFKEFQKGPVLRLKKTKHKIDEQAKALNIKYDSLKMRVGNLSGGNQQKVVIGKWLLAKSSVIMMDEPTRGIDVGAKEEVYEIIKRLAQEGKAIIFVSSELEEVQRVSERILVMRNGMIVGELPSNAELEDIMRYATGTNKQIG